MQRVMICGGPGSGKSWLARELGLRTGLPVTHMDRDVHWLPFWVERALADKARILADIYKRERWILEGGHSTSYAERLTRADTFIWLDVPLALRFWRVIWRTVTSYGQTRPDLPRNCPETFGPGKRQLLAYMWRTQNSNRAKLAAMFADPPAHVRAFRLCGRRDVAQYLASLERDMEVTTA